MLISASSNKILYISYPYTYSVSENTSEAAKLNLNININREEKVFNGKCCCSDKREKNKIT